MFPESPFPLGTRQSAAAPKKPKGEEEEDSYFNDTVEGPRAPAVKPGRITQLKLETPGAQAYCSTYYKAVRVGDSWLLLNTLNFELLNF